MTQKSKRNLKKSNPIRIIKPHTNKSRKIQKHNFLKGDFKKIEKVALDISMLAKNAENEGLFGNVYAVAHAQIIKKPLAFFIINAGNVRIWESFKGFVNEYGPIIMNPRITRHSKDKMGMEEGCLSFPGKEMIMVKRWYKIEVEFEYLTFSEKTEKVNGIKTGDAKLKGFYAQLFQHEIDHINGINIY